MAQEEKILLDLDEVFHYKNLSDRHRKIMAGVCVAVFVIGLLSFAKDYFKKPKKEVIRPCYVQTRLVIQKDSPVYIESFGTLVTLYDVNIQSQVTGQIWEVHFEEGDRVSKGDMLFTIDPREYKADLDKAEASLAEDLADLKLSRDTLERNRSLVKKELISKQDFEDYQTNVAASEARVQLDRAEIALKKINLDYCYIRAPIGGITGKRLVDPGNIVIANSGPTLVNIKSNDPLYIDFTVPERELPRVRDAMAKSKLKVEINVEGDKSGPYSGQLYFIDNTVDDMTGTVALRAEIPNKEGLLWVGQFVKVRLILGIDKNAILAPYQAVRIGKKGSYLFVVTPDDRADLRQVVPTYLEGDYIVIEKGVEVGEKAVVVGQLGLSPGVPVVEVEKKGDQEDQNKGKEKDK